MAGSGLLIINILQADQAALLNPRIQAVRGKQNNSGPGSPLPSNVNSPIQQSAISLCFVFISVYNCLDAGQWRDQACQTEAAVDRFACSVTGLQLQRAHFTQR